MLIFLIIRCKIHTRDGGSILKNRSFVQVAKAQAEYVQDCPILCCPSEQITVFIPLDVKEMLQNADSCVVDNSQLYLLPEVQAELLCSLKCYNSCLGLHSKGEIELIITLESKNE